MPASRGRSGGRLPERCRWIAGNLDCEVDFARADARVRGERGEKAPPGDDPRFGLPPAVLRSISALATLLRAFAGEGDRLWTPLPVDPARMARVPGLPAPLLESGALEAIPAAAGILAWGETGAVEEARARLLSQGGASGEATGRGSDPVEGAAGRAAGSPATAPQNGAGLLWRAPPAAAATAVRVNHRTFAHDLARSLGVSLAGSRPVGSVEELEGHLAAGGASASPGEEWVLKAPLSAAGRLRLRGRGRSLDPPSRLRAEGLLALFGVLLFEPWMDRAADFGSLGIIEEGAVRLLGVHQQEVGPGGVFRGVVLAPPGAPRGLADRERESFEMITREAGQALKAAGYLGPFGIDGFTFRGREGGVRLHPLGEINARMTMGLAARALLERVQEAGLLERSSMARLRAGKVRIPSAGRVVPLLLPGAEDPTAAWLEALEDAGG